MMNAGCWLPVFALPVALRVGGGRVENKVKRCCFVGWMESEVAVCVRLSCWSGKETARRGLLVFGCGLCVKVCVCVCVCFWGGGIGAVPACELAGGAVSTGFKLPRLSPFFGTVQPQQSSEQKEQHSDHS